MDLGLAGKLCLVSGASRGIGRAIALALVREGARVAGVARGEADLVKLVADGGAHATIVADVTTADGACSPRGVGSTSSSTTPAGSFPHLHS